MIDNPRPWQRFDAERDNRMARACRLIGALGEGGAWLPWVPLVATVSAACGLTPKCVDNAVRGMVSRTGDLERCGRYGRTNDTRAVRLTAAAKVR